MNFYYLGLIEKTIQYNNFFKKAVLVSDSISDKNFTYKKLYGENIDYNELKNFKKISRFYDRCVKIILKEDKDAKFIIYNQAGAKYMHTKKNVLCLNNAKLIDKLNNKPISRKILKDNINLLTYKYLKGKDIHSFDSINSLFRKQSRKYVIQQPVGFGGLGTYIINKHNSQEILDKLEKNTTYSISEFVENSIPINHTFIISKNNILLFDASLQIIEETNELNYAGFDFDGYKNLKQSLKDKINEQTVKITKKLQKLGYRGIGGIDYIVKDNIVYYMEINPRFQGSSYEIDKQLITKALPSIFQLNYLSFYDENNFTKIIKKLQNY